MLKANAERTQLHSNADDEKDQTYEIALADFNRDEEEADVVRDGVQPVADEMANVQNANAQYQAAQNDQYAYEFYDAWHNFWDWLEWPELGPFTSGFNFDFSMLLSDFYIMGTNPIETALGALSGLGDGSLMILNQVTLELIPALDQYTEQRKEEMGGAYVVADWFAFIGVNAGFSVIPVPNLAWLDDVGRFGKHANKLDDARAIAHNPSKPNFGTFGGDGARISGGRKFLEAERRLKAYENQIVRELVELATTSPGASQVHLLDQLRAVGNALKNLPFGVN